MDTARTALSKTQHWTTLASGLMLVLAATGAQAQAMLCDFNGSVLLHSSLPLDLSQAGINAHFTATGDGFSIQDPSQSLGLVPAGFSGYAICPNGVFGGDLHVSFNVVLSDFSILVAPHELACDTSATLRVTGYLGANFVATATSQATNPGTWPSSMLSLNAPQGFNNVVVHYDSAPPPGSCDYGVIFAADDMLATPLDKIFANGFE